MSKARFLIILIIAAAVSAASSSHVNAGGYYYDGGYGGYYPPPYYEPYDRGYYDAAYYGYGPAYGAAEYGLAGLLLPFLWGSWGPADDYCHQRIRVYDNWGGWVWGHRVVC